MKQKIILVVLAFSLVVSCKKDHEDFTKDLQEFSLKMEMNGYHMGEQIDFPESITKDARSVRIGFGDKEISDLKTDPKYFALGSNKVTINIEKKDGENVSKDATINVYAPKPEQNVAYEIINEYPHDPGNFTQGFEYANGGIYESDGKNGYSKLIYYTLGSDKPQKEIKLDARYFAEGLTLANSKIYQLTWHSKKGFIYDLNMNKIGEFPYPDAMVEGWGLTFDGSHLIASDGSKNLFFLDINNPQKVLKYINAVGYQEAYSQLNELEYHNGYIYANIWQQPIIIKIDPKSGEVVGKFDFSEIAKKNTKGSDDVLNGIAFKGENMLVTGKNWPKIYEVKIK